MRTTLKAVLAASAITLLAGCSATPTKPVVDPVYKVDVERMTLITEVARQHGVRVIWVNAPKVAVTGNQ